MFGGVNVEFENCDNMLMSLNYTIYIYGNLTTHLSSSLVSLGVYSNFFGSEVRGRKGRKDKEFCLFGAIFGLFLEEFFNFQGIFENILAVDGVFFNFFCPRGPILPLLYC